MAEYTFKKLSEVEALTEVPEGANAFIEVNGEIKRVSGDGLGGGGIKTAIIKSSDYDNALAGVQTALAGAVTFECINMTFEEAYETMMKGEPLAAHVMLVSNSVFGTLPASMVAFDTSINSFALATEAVRLYWTADGISTEAPASA